MHFKGLKNKKTKSDMFCGTPCSKSKEFGEAAQAVDRVECCQFGLVGSRELVQSGRLPGSHSRYGAAGGGEVTL